MHWLDITILVILGVGAGFGFWTGLLWQVARVISLIIALYVSIAGNAYVAEWLGEQWPDTNEIVCKIAAFVVVFLFVYVILYLATHLIHRAIKETKLELVDRILGALLGMVKTGMVVSMLCAGIGALGIQMTRTWMEESALAPAFATGTDYAIGLVPQEYRAKFNNNLREAREQLEKKAADAAMDALKK